MVFCDTIFTMNQQIQKPSNARMLARDGLIIAISILVSVIIVKSGVVNWLITKLGDLQYIGSFVSGMFFTSVFTTAPAIVALGEFAKTGSIVVTALLGATGAVIGDVLIFRFVRDEISGHLEHLKIPMPWHKQLHAIFKRRMFRWIPFFVGGLIIASPLPDELGVGLLGLSHANTKFFLVISFVFNFIGIVLIGLVAKAV